MTQSSFMIDLPEHDLLVIPGTRLHHYLHLYHVARHTSHNAELMAARCGAPLLSRASLRLAAVADSQLCVRNGCMNAISDWMALHAPSRCDAYQEEVRRRSEQ